MISALSGLKQARAFSLVLIMAGLLSSCATYREDDAGIAKTSTAEPAAQASEDNAAIYANYFFKASIPDNWTVISSDGPDIPAFISVQKKDRSALVTVKVSRTDLEIDELCQLAAKGFVVNSADIVRGPEVQYGTCIIQSDTLGKKAGFWARRYEDKSVYAINFEGDLEAVGEILGRMEGNEKFMQLFVMPLR